MPQGLAFSGRCTSPPWPWCCSGLPSLFHRPPPQETPIAVQLVTIAPETRATQPNPFKPKPEAKPEPPVAALAPKPEPKPEPPPPAAEPPSAAAPPPPPPAPPEARSQGAAGAAAPATQTGRGSGAIRPRLHPAEPRPSQAGASRTAPEAGPGGF